MRDEDESTRRIDVSDSDATAEIRTDPVVPEEVPERARRPLQNAIAAGWLEIVQAGALAFLVLLLAGGVIVLAAKLNFPSIGAGADLVAAINAIVIAGLAILGTPVVFEDVATSILPLGALILAGWGILWAVRTTIRPPQGDAAEIVRDGARLAAPFALLCWIAALVFRFRGRHPVGADAGAALLISAFWGALFGALGALQTRKPLRTWVLAAWQTMRSRLGVLESGVFAGGAALAVVAITAAGGMLLWIIISLARDAPGRYFSAGDAAAYVVYLVAMLPNAIATVATVAFGSGVDVGARLNLSGELGDVTREFSFWTWGGRDAPAVIYLLALIPIASALGGGFIARRRTQDPSHMPVILLTMSSIVAVVLTLLGWVAKMRLAGVGRGIGYAAIQPDVVVLFFASFLISGVVGAAGWFLADRTAFLERVRRT